MTKYSIFFLNDKSVSMRMHEENENGDKIGSYMRKIYVNSEHGRQEVENELPQAQVNAIFAVWGDTPTVDESIA